MATEGRPLPMFLEEEMVILIVVGIMAVAFYLCICAINPNDDEPSPAADQLFLKMSVKKHE